MYGPGAGGPSRLLKYSRASGTCSAAASAFFAAAAFRMLEVSPKTCVFSAVQHGFLILFPFTPAPADGFAPSCAVA